MLLVVVVPTALFASEQLFLIRHTPTVWKKPDDLTRATETALYKPLFGQGDKQADLLNGVIRFGELTVEAQGRSSVVSYPSEEQIYYILEGEGKLIYGDEQFPVRQNDFMYLPLGVKHGVINNSNLPIRLLVMGYSVPSDVEVQQTEELQIANTEDVDLQVLGYHGPTTRFQLLMGTTESDRDELACAYQMVSLFIMDFLPTGTNIPHRHETQEEIYYVLRGYGNMVAGVDKWGNGMRHPSQAGDAFYFAAGTQVGFFSGGKEGEEHAMILAVRSNDPTLTSPRKN
ncbi:MAG: cupin domain-containing protein [Opitutae bacterium]|nr:cupin domain-containing protein [Opitutae bacterium]